MVQDQLKKKKAFLHNPSKVERSATHSAGRQGSCNWMC